MKKFFLGLLLIMNFFVLQQAFAMANGVNAIDGNETNYFGLATRNALIKYQIANNIKPAVGYFGSVTRGVVNK